MMEDLKPMMGAQHDRVSDPDQPVSLHPLSIPPRDLQEAVDPAAIRQAAREAGELWMRRTLHKRRDLWWDYLSVAETDAGRATARCAINALSMAIGRRAQREEQSFQQPQSPRQVIELQISIASGPARG